MLKEEAIKLMKQGVKITHSTFSDDECMTIENGKILFEDDCKCPIDEFWDYRKEECWEDGYSIFEEKQNA
jgi:hypothetical protein